MDSHELMCGSMPPPIFCLAISSTGLAANAADVTMHTSAMTITVITVPSIRRVFCDGRDGCADMIPPTFST